MWIRILEFLMALWLLASPFIFVYEDGFWWVNDAVCAILIGLFSLLSFYPKLNRIHLCHYFVVIWLFIIDYSRGYPLPPFMQNYQVMAFILSMTALIPCHSHLPPKPWRKFED